MDAVIGALLVAVGIVLLVIGGLTWPASGWPGSPARSPRPRASASSPMTPLREDGWTTPFSTCPSLIAPLFEAESSILLAEVGNYLY